MGKRYYCEFCDKQFGDNPSSRRNHLTGVFHQRMKKLYYDSFKGPEAALVEADRGMCRAFQTTGECNYGDRCHYSHMTSDDRARLALQIQQKKDAENAKRKRKTDFNPSLEDWLAQRANKIKSEDPHHSSQLRPDQFPHYTLHPSLLSMPNIPPSLLPPPADAFNNLRAEDWG